MLIFDTFAKLLCLLLLISSQILDSSILIPLFTLQETFQNQLLTLLDNLSSIRSNFSAVKRLLELEEGDDYRLKINRIEKKEAEVLYANNVSVQTAEGYTLLNSVSFCIKKGEKIALVGENGSGKTTLIRALMGLVPLVSGEVIIYGSLGYSPVSHQFYEISLKDNCAMIKNNAFKDEGYTNLFPMPDLIANSNNICELSFGQIQLASLFRSQVNSPSLLVLDEPTHGLSQQTAREVMNFLLSLPCALLYITHDRNFANRADTIYTMNNGKLEVYKND